MANNNNVELLLDEQQELMMVDDNNITTNEDADSRLFSTKSITFSTAAAAAAEVDSYLAPSPLIGGNGPCPKCNRYAFGVYCLLLIMWLAAGTLAFNYFECDAEMMATITPPENVSFDNVADLNHFVTTPFAHGINIVNVTIEVIYHQKRPQQILTIFYYNLTTPQNQETSTASTAVKWDLAGSLFFCVALLATVGYGANLAPKTIYGQICCVIFATVGIPLFIAVAAELRRQIVQICEKVIVAASSSSKCNNNNNNNSNNNRKNNKFQNSTDEDFASATLAIILTVSLVASLIFVIGPAFLFWHMEPNWSLLNALYFSFISLTTIGFGDLIAGGYDERSTTIPGCCGTCLYRVFLSLWLFFGLIFVATFFGTVHEFLSRKITSGRCCPHHRNVADNNRQTTTATLSTPPPPPLSSSVSTSTTTPANSFMIVLNGKP